jgi:hypothetical protein
VSEAVERLIEFAKTTLGWSDEDNTKRTPVHTWYNEKFGNPDPGKYAWDWCDGWITYIAWKTNNQAAVVFNSGFSYTVSHVEAFKKKGLWHAGAKGIQRGDIVFFDWLDGGGIEHVGLVLGVKADGSVETIEGNTLNTVAYRTRLAKNVAGYGRPKYSSTTTTPEPQPPKEVPVTTVIFEDLGPGGKAAANKVVQAALNKFAPPVVVDGDWGPQTMGAYHKWQVSLGYTGSVSRPGSDADGRPGWTSASRLAAKYGFTLVRRSSVPTAPVKPTPTGTPKPSTGGTPSMSSYQELPEPAHSYQRVTYGGRTVNVRTREMLKLAAAWTGVTFTLTQGSYNRGVSASAGTHDGGGVIDINVNSWSSSKRAAVVQALRKAGFAAWLRTPAQGFAYHIHACAIGDKEMASVAKSQVQSYFNGRNGLASNGRTEGETHWPNWADKYNH